MNKFLWPLVGFVVLVVFLAIGLRLNPRDVPSPLVGKPAPTFNLPTVAAPDKNFGPADLRGKVWLLNVWASWCVSCRQEHPVLVEFSKRSSIPLVGLNYKEIRGDANFDMNKIAAPEEKQMALQRAHLWLNKHGDPYRLSVLDLDGRVGIDYGVYGVPETYVIDKAGIIRLKYTGPISPDVVDKQILPLVAELEKASI
jgi:cytochrome c biogenesis protein CcmG/thiol:disulfide interchange protein DsbE